MQLIGYVETADSVVIYQFTVSVVDRKYNWLTIL